MLNRSNAHILIVILALITLSACGSSGNTSPEGDGLDGPAVTALAEEGSAEIHYHYKIDNPLVNFKIEPVIQLVIAPGDSPGSFVAQGIGQTWATLEMMAGGGPSGSCQFQCEMLLRYEVNTKVELDDFNNDCMIPVTFAFQATNDESILTGDCPQEFMEVVDCAALSAVMVDPSLYTFTKEIRELDLEADAGVTLSAEIKNVIMPRGVKGICNW